MLRLSFLFLIVTCSWWYRPSSAADPRIDLSCWMLNLPTDTRKPGFTDEIEPPEIESFSRKPWFVQEAAGSRLRCRANCGGATTRNSSYPRSELREWDRLTNERAAWSTSSGWHEMTLRARFLKLPSNKSHAVCGQIHDGDDDVLMVRLEGTKLFIERNELDTVMLDRKYNLGDQIDVRMVAHDGRIQAWYDGRKVLDWEVDRDGCYFKAGCYTLSNPSRGDDPDDYAEVVIDRLRIKHSSRPE